MMFILHDRVHIFPSMPFRKEPLSAFQMPTSSKKTSSVVDKAGDRNGPKMSLVSQVPVCA